MPTIQTHDNRGIYYKYRGRGRAVVFSHRWPLSNAQELAASASNAARPANGWWSPVGEESATAPQLPISMAELIPFKASDSFRPFRPSGRRTA